MFMQERPARAFYHVTREDQKDMIVTDNKGDRMSLTNLTARAVYDPKGCRSQILDEADRLDYETRPLAGALGVSYPTLLRVLRRLELHQRIRELWLNRRNEKRASGVRYAKS